MQQLEWGPGSTLGAESLGPAVSPGRPRTPRSARRRRAAKNVTRRHSLGITVTRSLLGLLFVGHGTQKLFGAFEGPGLDKTAESFDAIGLQPGQTMAAVAGATETLGGSLLALGAFTPLASAMLTGVMTSAIKTVHWPKGPWVTKGGYEYNALIIATLFAITDVGPGPVSVDAVRRREHKGPIWALAELAAGIGTATAFSPIRAKPRARPPSAAHRRRSSPPRQPDNASDQAQAGSRNLGMTSVPMSSMVCITASWGTL